MVDSSREVAFMVYIPDGELESRVFKKIIFINGQIKTYVTSFNGNQNVC